MISDLDSPFGLTLFDEQSKDWSVPICIRIPNCIYLCAHESLDISMENDVGKYYTAEIPHISFLLPHKAPSGNLTQATRHSYPIYWLLVLYHSHFLDYTMLIIH